MPLKKFLAFVFLLFLSCNEEKTTSDSLLSLVPKNAAVIIRINNYQAFKSELKNNTFLQKIEKTELYTSLINKINALDKIQPISESILAFVEVGKENFEFIYFTQNQADFFTSNDANAESETIPYENSTYHKYLFEDNSIFYLNQDNKIILSSSQILIENFIRSSKNQTTSKTLEKLYQVASTNKSATVFINTANSNPILSSKLKIGLSYELSNFSDWVSMDFNMGQDQIQFNGLSMANDSLTHFINLFKNTKPLAHTTPFFAPLHADAILSYTFDDYSKFALNQKKYLENAQAIDTLFNAVEEIGSIYMNSKKAVLLKTFGSENISDFLNNKSSIGENYQGVDILKLNFPNFLNDNFKPLVSDFSTNFYIVLENTFVFSSDEETLQTLISNYKNGATYNKNEAYISSLNVMASESNLLFVANFKGLKNVLKKDLNSNALKDINKANLEDYAFSAQWVADANFYHTSATAIKINQKVSKNTISPLYTVQLDADIATQPQFVTNHRTNMQEIVIQDIDNNLYLISTGGKVLWKKQLSSKIQGKIKQVDLYKNGRLQLAFTTNNQFLILDRNGEEVPPFNKTYEGGNLNELAVFDYENQRQYRFIVTQGEKVFMYNNKADIVSGFKFTKATSPIITAPKHFKLAKKDYLFFKLSDNSVKIVHRSGADRIIISDKIDFSDNEVFLYKNKFSLTDNKGTLHQIDAAGKLTKTNFNLNKDHSMDATSKTLALMNENILSIKGKKVELEIGVYTQPKIFYINDKIYVSVTDIQSQKIYLYDSQAKSIANFPVYGNSLIDLADIDNDKKLELVAKDLENSIIVYKIN